MSTRWPALAILEALGRILRANIGRHLDLIKSRVKARYTSLNSALDIGIRHGYSQKPQLYAKGCSHKNNNNKTAIISNFYSAIWSLLHRRNVPLKRNEANERMFANSASENTHTSCVKQANGVQYRIRRGDAERRKRQSLECRTQRQHIIARENIFDRH